MGSAATTRRPALAATNGGAPGRRAGGGPVPAGRGAPGCCRLPPLRALLVGPTGVRVPPQLGLLGAAALHRHWRRGTLVRRGVTLVEPPRSRWLPRRGRGGGAPDRRQRGPL